MTRFLLLSALLAPSVALAVPSTLNHQGRVLDSAGAAVTGDHDVTVRIYADGASTAAWEEVHSAVSFDEGYFTLELGSVTAIDSSVFADDADLTITLQLDTDAELPAQAINSVPTALVAGVALNVAAGASIDAGSISVGGTEVISTDGTIDFSALVNAPEASDTLAELSSSCTDGQVAIYDGTNWACAAQLPDTIPTSMLDGTISADNLPFGTSADTISEGDHTHGFAAITGTLTADQLPATTKFAPDGSDEKNAANSCRRLLEDYPSTSSGTYWLDPDGGSSADAFEAFCDMTYDGGGWTLIGVEIGGSTAAGRLKTGTDISGLRVATCDTAARSWTEPCWVADRNLFAHHTEILVKGGRDLDSNGNKFDDQLAFTKLRFNGSRPDVAWTRIVGNDYWAGANGEIYDFNAKTWGAVPDGNANHHSQIPVGNWIHWNTANVTASGSQSATWGRNDVNIKWIDPTIGNRANVTANTSDIMMEIYVRGN